MARVLNAVGFQLVWWTAVLGAAAGWPLLGAGVAAAFVAAQVATSSRRVPDLRLLAIALLLGTVLDGLLASMHLVVYAAAWPAAPGGAPLWILGLWAAFALTINHSLSAVVARPALAVLLGLVGGPLAYLGAARLQAATLAPPAAAALGALAAGWGGAMGLFVWAVRAEEGRAHV